MARYPKKGSGVGNKQGSTRPNFFAFITPQDITDYMVWVKANYKEDKALAKWYGDHIFGMAMQPLGNPDGTPLQVLVPAAVAQAFGIHATNP